MKARAERNSGSGGQGEAQGGEAAAVAGAASSSGRVSFTKVPRVGEVETQPCASSSATAASTVLRLRPSSSAQGRLPGSCWPGLRRPRRMSRITPARDAEEDGAGAVRARG